MHRNTKAAKRSLLTTLALSLALVATTSAVHGAGFAIYETDARGFAMGNANVGRNDDASALYSNPAAITQLPGIQVKVGLSFIQPSIDVTTYNSTDGSFKDPKTTTSMNSYTAVIPNVYGTYRINDDMAVGLAVFVPYGLKSDFSYHPDVWPGAYNNYFTEIKTYEIAPTFAYRLVHDQSWAKQISVAAGIAFLRTDITLKRATDPTGINPFILDGNSWEYGYNLAVQYEVNDQLSFGIVYRSGFDVKITGASAQLGQQRGNNAWGKMNLPDSWSFGVNYSPVAPLNIGFQALRTNWGSYDKLTIVHNLPDIPERDPLPIPKHWKDVWRYSLGGEYQVNNALALRAGVVIDKDPVNSKYADFMVPSNDRQIFSIGAGWTINQNIALDFAYGYLKIKSSKIAARPEDGIRSDAFIHTGHAHIFSVSANFRF